MQDEPQPHTLNPKPLTLKPNAKGASITSVLAKPKSSSGKTPTAFRQQGPDQNVKSCDRTIGTHGAMLCRSCVWVPCRSCGVVDTTTAFWRRGCDFSKEFLHPRVFLHRKRAPPPPQTGTCALRFFHRPCEKLHKKKVRGLACKECSSILKPKP